MGKVKTGDVVEILGREDGKGYVVIEASPDGNVSIEEITPFHLKPSFQIAQDKLRALF